MLPLPAPHGIPEQPLTLVERALTMRAEALRPTIWQLRYGSPIQLVRGEPGTPATRSTVPADAARTVIGDRSGAIFKS
jgi:hypothetical protein